jgi:NAD(P)H-flavin reductase
MASVVEPAVRAGPGPLTPVPYRVVERRGETEDVVTLELEPVNGPPLTFRPGQFNMVTSFGVGEVALSVSSAPGDRAPLAHTVRDVGATTHALCQTPVGGVVGIRGPFGTHWGVDGLEGTDVVVVAGGIGVAPLRGVVEQLVGSGPPEGGRPAPVGTPRTTDRVCKLTVLIGARRPEQLIFADDIGRWRASGATVEVTVDVAGSSWEGHVGVVTTLIASASFDASEAVALVCGPEVMMRYCARALLEIGVVPERIHLSLERNMQCGVGICGHCQLGPLLLCRDGPVVRYNDVVADLLLQRER